MPNCIPRVIAPSLCVLALLTAATSAAMAQSNSCPDGSQPQIFTALAEAVGLENAKRLANDSLDRLLSRNGVTITMTSRRLEPTCLFTEIGNNAQCEAMVEICP